MNKLRTIGFVVLAVLGLLAIIYCILNNEQYHGEVDVEKDYTNGHGVGGRDNNVLVHPDYISKLVVLGLRFINFVKEHESAKYLVAAACTILLAYILFYGVLVPILTSMIPYTRPVVIIPERDITIDDDQSHCGVKVGSLVLVITAALAISLVIMFGYRKWKINEEKEFKLKPSMGSAYMFFKKLKKFPTINLQEGKSHAGFTVMCNGDSRHYLLPDDDDNTSGDKVLLAVYKRYHRLLKQPFMVCFNNLPIRDDWSEFDLKQKLLTVKRIKKLEDIDDEHFEFGESAMDNM